MQAITRPGKYQRMCSMTYGGDGSFDVFEVSNLNLKDLESYLDYNYIDIYTIIGARNNNLE